MKFQIFAVAYLLIAKLYYSNGNSQDDLQTSKRANNNNIAKDSKSNFIFNGSNSVYDYKQWNTSDVSSGDFEYFDFQEKKFISTKVHVQEATTAASLKFFIKRDTLSELNETLFKEELDLNSTASEEEYINDIKNYIFPKPWMWVLIFLNFIVFVIGIVGNFLVCLAVYRNHTMRTVTNYFIVNLAVADFMVILACLVPSVIWDVTMTWFLGAALCKIVLYLQTVSVTVSVLTLTFISVDRWYAICFPLKFTSTTGRAKTAIGIIWFIALGFDIPELVVYQTVPNKMLQIETIYFTQCEPNWSTNTETTWMILKMILLYAFPLLFMSIAYCQIICVLWKSANIHQHSVDISGGRQINTFTMNTNASTEGQLRSRRKAAKMIVAVVIMFAVCYFPVHLLSVLRATISMSNTDFNQALFSIAHWLCYANSAVNPIIYNFMSGKFRKEFHRAFENCCKPTPINQGSYRLNRMYSKNRDKDSGIATRSLTRSSKKKSIEAIEVRRVSTVENKARTNSFKTILTNFEV